MFRIVRTPVALAIVAVFSAACTVESGSTLTAKDASAVAESVETFPLTYESVSIDQVTDTAMATESVQAAAYEAVQTSVTDNMIPTGTYYVAAQPSMLRAVSTRTLPITVIQGSTRTTAPVYDARPVQTVRYVRKTAPVVSNTARAAQNSMPAETDAPYFVPTASLKPVVIQPAPAIPTQTVLDIQP